MGRPLGISGFAPVDALPSVGSSKFGDTVVLSTNSHAYVFLGGTVNWYDLTASTSGPPLSASYTITNDGTDRAFDANATSLDELADVLATLIRDLGAGNRATYTVTNRTTDRVYDANSTTVDEVADVLGTLILDLQNSGWLT